MCHLFRLDNSRRIEPPATEVAGFLLRRLLLPDESLTKAPQAIPVVPTVQILRLSVAVTLR